LALVNSAGHARENLLFFHKQLIFAGMGFVIMIVATMIPSRIYYMFAYIIYGLSILLLLLVIIGGVAGFGAKRWLVIGGFRLQPSEPAKIGLIFAAARFLADWREDAGWRIIFSVALLAAPIAFIVLLQPDLGTSTVFPIITLAMLAWFGLQPRYFIVMLLPILSLFLLVNPWFIAPVIILGLIWFWRSDKNWIRVLLLAILCAATTTAAPMIWDKLEPYQKSRLSTFLDPTADPLGAGYQVIQSRVAIGSGGILGLGYLQGTQTQLRFLPQQHTDFIFSLAGEELGFIGTSIILFLYFLFGWRSFRAAALIKNQFMSLTTAGIAVLILYHCTVNIGMALGNLPVTGLPLPFLSYGGSFMLTCMLACGLILSAGLYRREY